MGTEESEEVLTLLKELSVLKELEKEPGLGHTSSKRGAHRIRRQEIAQEIQSLAEQKKNKETSE
jgi:hypothetical protein